MSTATKTAIMATVWMKLRHGPLQAQSTPLQGERGLAASAGRHLPQPPPPVATQRRPRKHGRRRALHPPTNGHTISTPRVSAMPSPPPLPNTYPERSPDGVAPGCQVTTCYRRATATLGEGGRTPTATRTRTATPTPPLHRPRRPHGYEAAPTDPPADARRSGPPLRQSRRLHGSAWHPSPPPSVSPAPPPPPSPPLHLHRPLPGRRPATPPPPPPASANLVPVRVSFGVCLLGCRVVGGRRGEGALRAVAAACWCCHGTATHAMPAA